MNLIQSTRRDFLKTSTLATAGLSVLASKNAAAQILIENKIQNFSPGSNYSIQNVDYNNSSSIDFNGDNINRPHEILWDLDNYVAGKGGWPTADRQIEVIVVGGGMSGLLSSYFLRKHKPLLLEQDTKLGGNSKGEIYNKSAYSIGAAYITVPDEGSDIQNFLKEIHLFEKAKLESEKDVQSFFKSSFVTGFWDGVTDPPRAEEFKAVASELSRIYNEEYPDIPFNLNGAIGIQQWKDLDQISFQKWLTSKWPNLHPHIQEFFQVYAWSSFNGSIDELSALQMLNFLTAETVGVLAFPAGNSLMAFQLQKVLEQQSCPIESDAFVIQVKTTTDGVQVTYENGQGHLKAVLCKACVVAAPKFVASRIVPELTAEKINLIQKIPYRGYVVVNVILNKKIQTKSFDVFMLTGESPESPSAMNQSTRGFTDVCFGSWAQGDQVDESILSIYKPLPYDGARQFLFSPTAHQKSKNQILPDLEVYLQKLNLTLKDVKGIRLTRWGHSLPVACVGFLASGQLDMINQPISQKIYFANQDNFANPAFETSFAAAQKAANDILAILN